MPPHSSAQSYEGDPRNDDALIWLNGDFVHRDKATVSVFDAGFVLGDGIWEGIRLVNGKLLSLDLHLDRLFEGARAISLDIGMTREAVTNALLATCERNGFSTDTHIRLMISRGRKTTPNQDPRFMASGATVVIIAEIKRPRTEFAESGLKLFTSTFRCSTPDVFDLRLNSHSRLNLIQALVQAIAAGADEALMLDQRGYVASCNSTNFFIVRKGQLWTSPGLFSFNGITRGHVIALFGEKIGPSFQKDFTLTQAYSADEAFVTGTLGGVTPVTQIDGHVIGDGKPGPKTQEITKVYWDWVKEIGA
ncbi:aminotransferase class IV [Jiella sp. MQZ9-1]|uniref:Probable branched-chain-amino-acid aminotransferase n=1 Tax=Jiella flava TaxID=2816857 RepID=A0A939JWL5_9HYPH|nr:aminotransferase class IV [Jiella flava]MBO0662436.1 aminotransferase class IV [Jiella flava]MCD2471659.1 aminotransferase class IV [Jiella flava]